MIILCTGMFRSGSTWSFNIVKSIIEINHENKSIFSEYNESLQSTIVEHSMEFDNLVIKCHKIDTFGKGMIKHGCTKVIYTYREPLEALTSLMQKFNFTFALALDSIKESLELMQFQKKYSNVLILSYNEIISKSESSIKKITQHLDAELTDDAIRELAIEFNKDNVKKNSNKISKSDKNTIDVGFSIYDKTSLFHKNHIRENQDFFLSDDQRMHAISILKPYVDDDGKLIVQS